MTRKFSVSFFVSVDLTVNDEDVITRVIENHNDEHIPMARVPRDQPWDIANRGWKDIYYDLDTKGVIEMLARTCGIQDQYLSHLDGWADLPNDALDIGEVYIELDDVTELTPDGRLK